MTRPEIIAEVEAEIVRLENIRALLKQSNSERFTVPEVDLEAGRNTKKRTLSPEARRRIVQAQKQRWAKQKRDAVAAPQGQ